jgi:hypothetical protein
MFDWISLVLNLNLARKFQNLVHFVNKKNVEGFNIGQRLYALCFLQVLEVKYGVTHSISSSIM